MQTKKIARRQPGWPVSSAYLILSWVIMACVAVLMASSLTYLQPIIQFLHHLWPGSR